MLTRILGSLASHRKMNRHNAARINVVGHRKRLRHEHLEDRCMLATLTVSVDSDGAVAPFDGNLTLREAIAYVNGTSTPGLADRAWIDESMNILGENDAIVFASDLNGGMITISGGKLVVFERVTITGPAGGITIQKGASSSATTGLSFQSFDLSPGGRVSR